jgi:ABC-type dipeptide/oligopeptide/nickel transport system permease component
LEIFSKIRKFHLGFVPFVSKYFEYQHQLDTSTATLITGVIALLSVIIGCPLGAYCINKYSWTPMRCARVCAIILSISSFLFLFLTFSCPELKFQYTACTSTDTSCCNDIYHPGKLLTYHIDMNFP